MGVGTGTDALAIALRALDIGPGAEVITSPLSAAYTALAIVAAGARPVFADIDPSRLTLDPAAAAAAVTSRTAAIMPVHLYGQAGGHAGHHERGLAPRPRRHRGLLPGAPCDLSRGARWVRSGRRPLTASIRPRTSAALGDGGALTTNDAASRGARQAAQKRRPDRSLPTRRVRRELAPRRDAGGDAARAARLLPGWTERRRALGREYRTALNDAAAVNVPPEHDAGHVYHLFPVLSPARESVREQLAAAGIETLIHYPIPISSAACHRRQPTTVRSPIASAHRCFRCRSTLRSRRRQFTGLLRPCVPARSRPQTTDRCPGDVDLGREPAPHRMAAGRDRFSPADRVTAIGAPRCPRKSALFWQVAHQPRAVSRRRPRARRCSIATASLGSSSSRPYWSLALAAAARFRLKLGGPPPTPHRTRRHGPDRPLGDTILPARRIRHRRQGSRDVHQRGNPDRTARHARLSRIRW